MLINGTNISTFGVICPSYEFGAAEVITYHNWLRNAYAPNIYAQEAQWSTLTISGVIKDADRDALDRNLSNLTAALNRCVVSFSSLSTKFDGFTTARNVEKLSPWAYRFSFELQGRKISQRTSVTLGTITLPATKTLNANGNSEVPCVLSWRLSAAVASVIITINGTEYKFENMTAGTYVFDAENGVFVKNGTTNAIANYLGFELPHIKGGANTLAFSGTAGGKLYDVAAEYEGRWQ